MNLVANVHCQQLVRRTIDQHYAIAMREVLTQLMRVFYHLKICQSMKFDWVDRTHRTPQSSLMLVRWFVQEKMDFIHLNKQKKALMN